MASSLAAASRWSDGVIVLGSHLNGAGEIAPGVDDVGDRLFGTEG